MQSRVSSNHFGQYRVIIKGKTYYEGHLKSNLPPLLIVFYSWERKASRILDAVSKY